MTDPTADQELEQRLRRTLQHVAATVTDDGSAGAGDRDAMGLPHEHRVVTTTPVELRPRPSRQRRTAVIASAAAALIGATWVFLPLSADEPERLATDPAPSTPTPTFIPDPAGADATNDFLSRLDDCAESKGIPVDRRPGGGRQWGPAKTPGQLERVRAECQQQLDVTAFGGMPARPTGLRLCEAAAPASSGRCTDFTAAQARDLVLHLFLSKPTIIPPCPPAPDEAAYELTFQTAKGPIDPLTMSMTECAPITGHTNEFKGQLSGAARELVRTAYTTGVVPPP